jgi:hypothetical protein
MHKNKDGDCLEPACFSVTYGIAAMCNASAVLISLLLVRLSDRPSAFSALSINDIDSVEEKSASNSNNNNRRGGGGGYRQTSSSSQNDSVSDTVSPLFSNLGTTTANLPERSLETCDLMEEERGSTIDPGSAHGLMYESHNKIRSSSSIGAIV